MVRPTERSDLTGISTELTGIQQEEVDVAKTLAETLELFTQWLCSNLPAKLAHSVVPVTCGDWDVRRVLMTEVNRKGLRCPYVLRSWCNLKRVYSETVGSRMISLRKMVNGLGLGPIGKRYSGIDGVYNSYAVVKALILDYGACLARASEQDSRAPPASLALKGSICIAVGSKVGGLLSSIPSEDIARYVINEEGGGRRKNATVLSVREDVGTPESGDEQCPSLRC